MHNLRFFVGAIGLAVFLPAGSNADFDREPLNYGEVAWHQYTSASPAGEDVAGYRFEAASIVQPELMGFDPQVLAMVTWGAYSDQADYQRFAALAGLPLDVPESVRLSEASRAYVAGGLEYQNADIGTNERDTGPTMRVGVRERHGPVEVDVHGRFVVGEFDYWATAAAAHYPVARTWTLFGGAELWDGDLGGFAGVSAQF